MQLIICFETSANPGLGIQMEDQVYVREIQVINLQHN
jgi:hypothetical protein